MSKIQRISVQNLKSIGKAEATFNGCTAIVTAGNGKGKTSFLRQLIDRMRSIKADRIVKENNTDGFYEMELTTGEKIRWEFEDKGKGLKEKMIFIDGKGQQKLTKDMCEYFFPKGFDIDKFLEQTPAEQRKQVYKICGINFEDIDKLIAEAVENRKYLNKKVTEDYARLGTLDKNLPDQEDKSWETIQEKINRAGELNAKIDSFEYKLSEKKNKLAENKNLIEQLRDEIKSLEDQNMQLETDIDKGEAALKLPQWKKAVDSDLTAMKKEVETIKNKNKLIEKNNEQRILYKEYDKTVENRNAAHSEVERLEKEKIDAITNCHTLPEGFGFTSDGVTYNGYPFEKQSLSLSAIYIAALKLASLSLGEVKAIHFEASALDKKSLHEIEKWAKSNDLQLLIERPDFEGGEIEYHIVDETK